MIFYFYFRCESASTENKSLSQIKRLNEDKIAALEERYRNICVFPEALFSTFGLHFLNASRVF